MTSNPDFEFQIGMTFHSWEECQKKIDIYDKKNHELLTTLRGERLYQCDFKNVHQTAQEIEKLIERLQYKYNILKCKFGPSTSKPKKQNTKNKYFQPPLSILY
ncbi:uncharacterized protein LOC141533064 [Cotesia typhae]|uniref:uncharacterized protein LOC141533064 n=1 Tax=Cotesia typhae TaxID=2053667 RepID=UPI003D691FBC